MKKKYIYYLTLVLLFCASSIKAQNTDPVTGSFTNDYNYTPGETVDITITGEWNKNLSKIEITFPEKITLNSCSPPGGDLEGYIFSNVEGQKIVITGQYGTIKGYHNPAAFNINLTFAADLSGDIDIPFVMVDRNDETNKLESTFKIKAISEAPLAKLIDENVDFEIFKIGETQIEKGINIQNIGAGDLMIEEITNIDGTPFNLISSLPITIASNETKEIKIDFDPSSSGYYEANIQINTNANSLDVPVKAIAYADGEYVCYDFEDLKVPNGWMSTATKGAVKWNAGSHNGSRLLIYAASEAAEGDEAELITSPVAMNTVGGDNFIAFKIKHNQQIYPECVDLYISSDEGETWTLIEKGINGSDNSRLEPKLYKLNDYVSNDFVQFKFVGKAQGVYNIMLDDIIIPKNYEVPTPPEAALNPVPSNGAQELPIFTKLSWDLPNYAKGNKILFGVTNPPTNEIDLKEERVYEPNLLENTTYYWQVIPYNDAGDAADCPVWSFTTGEYVPTQWSNDPAENLCLYPDASAALPKVRVASDGTYYIAWWRSVGGNYNVFLQHLSHSGEELWKHGGMVVSNFPQKSWLSDWDIRVDREDNVILAFPDERMEYMTMHAYKVSSKGEMLWGAGGVNLSGDNKDEKYSPEIAVLEDNSVVVAWDRIEGTNTVKGMAMAVDPDGNLLWDEKLGCEARSKLIPVSNNEFLVVGSFMLDVKAIRYKADKTIVKESVLKGIKTSTYSDIIVEPDGKDGIVVVSTYTMGLSSYVVGGYISGDGTTNWVKRPSMIQGNTHSDIQGSYMKDEDKVVFSWVEYKGKESQTFKAQLFDAETGEEQWGENGKEIIPMGKVACQVDHVFTNADKTLIVASEYGSEIPFPTVMKVYKLNIDGTFSWEKKFKMISTLNNSRLSNAATTVNQNQWLLAWEEQREGNRSKALYLQNLGIDGQLGLFDDNIAPRVHGVKFTANNKMIVNFSEAIDKTSAETIANYTIQDGPATATVTKAKLVNTRIVELTIEGLQDGNYNLVVDQVEDLAENKTDKYTINFDFLTDNDAPTIVSAVCLSDFKVGITFNEEVDEDSARKIKNYTLEQGNGKILAAKRINRTMVILDVEALTNGAYIIDITGLTDVRGNATDKLKANFTVELAEEVQDYYSEDFENGIPDDMTLVCEKTNVPNDDTFNKAWVAKTVGEDKVAASTSSFKNPTFANRWLVTPKISVKKGACLSWEAWSSDALLPEDYEVLLVNSENDLSEVTLIKTVNAEKETKTYHFVDLSAMGIADRSLRIAFRHKSDDAKILYIDNIKVYQPLLIDGGITKLEAHKYVTTTSKFPVTITCSNKGAETINKLKLRYLINDDEYTEELTFENLDIKMDQTATLVSAPISIATFGENKLKVWIDKVNDREDIFQTNNVATIMVNVVEGATNQLVTLEHFTNYACGPCAQQNPALEQLLEKNGNNAKVAHITYHSAYPGNQDPMYLFNKVDNKARLDYYNVQGVPCVFVNGGDKAISPAAVSQEIIDAQHAKANLFNLSGDANLKNSKYEVTMNLKSLVDLKGRDLVAHFIHVEDVTNDPSPNGETLFPNVMRKMLPSNKGTDITKLAKDDVTEFSFSYDEKYVFEESTLFVIVQDKETKEVVSSYNQKLKKLDGVQNITMGKLDVYPNPASQKLTVMGAEGSQYQILNSVGMLVMQGELNDRNSIINIRDLKNGVYMLKAINRENHVKVSKFIKE
ncbi:MAG: choice-of-anchor J domain-containing protein [Hyphomicrobiales bacterium]